MDSTITINHLADATISDIQSWFENQEITAADLVLLYLERIARFDRSGPTLNSVATINPDAYHIAQGLDQERRLGGIRGPLHGIPVLIKDNIATGDKMPTSAGSLAMRDVYAPEDAWVVERLRAAGAIILGKTNLTEWANFMTEEMPNGFSSRSGQVLNPYGPGQVDPGGSSSGSGSAVAAGLSAFAMGTETSGSILSPSTQHSLIGIKPTVGLLSRFGVVPISPSQDTAGPMCRTVKDAALVLAALTGVDPRDPATGASQGHYASNYTSGLDGEGLRGVRLGLPRAGFFDKLADWQHHLMEQAIGDLKRLGAEVVDPADLPESSLYHDFTVLTYEFKAALNAYFNWLGERTPIKSLQDLVAYNQAHPQECLKYGQTRLIAAQQTAGTLVEDLYIDARARDLRSSQSQGIDQVLSQHHLNGLIFPGAAGAEIAAKAGYPSITVPAGYSPQGEPLGITFSARAWEEASLIRWAYAYEMGTRRRKPPTLPKT